MFGRLCMRSSWSIHVIIHTDMRNVVLHCLHVVLHGWGGLLYKSYLVHRLWSEHDMILLLSMSTHVLIVARVYIQMVSVMHVGWRMGIHTSMQDVLVSSFHTCAVHHLHCFPFVGTHFGASDACSLLCALVFTWCWWFYVSLGTLGCIWHMFRCLPIPLDMYSYSPTLFLTFLVPFLVLHVFFRVLYMDITWWVTVVYDGYIHDYSAMDAVVVYTDAGSLRNTYLNGNWSCLTS